MNNNPLIAKWEELHGKKEESKSPEIKTTFTKDELEELAPYVNTNSNKIAVNSKSDNYIKATSHNVSIRPIKSYDSHSGEDAFLQIAEKVKNKDAKVICVTISSESSGIFSTGLQTITFEVQCLDGF